MTKVWIFYTYVRWIWRMAAGFFWFGDRGKILDWRLCMFALGGTVHWVGSIQSRYEFQRLILKRKRKPVSSRFDFNHVHLSSWCLDGLFENFILKGKISNFGLSQAWVVRSPPRPCVPLACSPSLLYSIGFPLTVSLGTARRPQEPTPIRFRPLKVFEFVSALRNGGCNLRKIHEHNIWTTTDTRTDVVNLARSLMPSSWDWWDWFSVLFLKKFWLIHSRPLLISAVRFDPNFTAVGPAWCSRFGGEHELFDPEWGLGLKGVQWRDVSCSFFEAGLPEWRWVAFSGIEWHWVALSVDRPSLTHASTRPDAAQAFLNVFERRWVA